MNNHNKIKKILLLTVMGSLLLLGHASYLKNQREKRQKVNKVIEEAKQSLAVVEASPHQFRQIGTVTPGTHAKHDTAL